MNKRLAECGNLAPGSNAAEGGGAASCFDAAEAGNLQPQPMPIASGLRPDRRYDVLLVTEDGGLLERVSAEFSGKNQFNLLPFGGRLPELEQKLANIKLPALLVIDFNQGSTLDIDALERLKKSHFSKVPVIAISNHLDHHIVRGLLLVKVDDWLPAGCLAAEIHSSCETTLRARLAETGDGEAKCISFFPAHGGCGNTTLGIEAAFLIGNRNKELQSTCLADLNFQDGAVADYLDLTPAFQLSELSQMSRRLDRQLLDVMLTRHRSGLAVLAAPRAPGQFVDIGEGLIASILGLLSEAFDHLIIDVPKNWSPWTDNVIWGSDRVFVVTGFTVPALRHSRFLAEAIASKAAAKTGVSVIVNKFHEPLMGAGLTRKDAESILETRLGGFIPNLGGVVDEAINRGMTLSEMRAGNKIGKRLSQVLDGDTRLAKAQK
ncbi:MAG: CpaE family protein [Rhodomicrobium sp.]